MAKRTIRQRIIAGLEARGEKLVKRTGRSDVYTCPLPGKYYYVGKIDSLRCGSNKVNSIPVDGIKATLLKEQV